MIETNEPRRATPDEAVEAREVTPLAALQDKPHAAPSRAAVHSPSQLILVDQIIADPDQPRKTLVQAELETLAAGMARNGQLQPIRVRWHAGAGLYVIIMGERRWRAALMNRWQHIDAIVHAAPLSDAERFEIQVEENGNRVDLNPIERAHGWAELQRLRRCSARELAIRLHVNVTTVTRALLLLKLPADIQELIKRGKIPQSVANAATKRKGENAQRALVDQYLAANPIAEEDEPAGKSGKSNKKTIKLPGGAKVTVASKGRQTHAEQIQALREALEILERKKKAA